MNIFILDEDIETNVKYHCDVHSHKMCVEYNQILSTVIRKKTDKCPDNLYKKTHVNHPCVLWAEKSLGNFQYLIKLTEALLGEYTFRYGKIHKSSLNLEVIKSMDYIDLFNEYEMTPFAVCTSDKFKHLPAVEAYRTYYREDKQTIAKWKFRDIPEFMSYK